MVVDERSRHELYRRLDEVLGEEAANTLIEHLPPVGWADVATKQDLAALEERLDLRFARVDDRFARVEDRFSRVDDQFDRIDERLGAMGDRFGALDEKLDERFEKFDERLLRTKFELQATFEKALRSQTLTVMFGLITVVMTMAALAFALVRFT